MTKIVVIYQLIYDRVIKKLYNLSIITSCKLQKSIY